MWGCSVREAQKQCDAREYAEWIAEYTIEPFGQERNDIMFAQISAQIKNALSRAGSNAAQLSDYMPKFGAARLEPHAVQSPKTMRAMFEQGAVAYQGARDRRKAKG